MITENIAYKFHPCGFRKCSPCYLKGYESTEIDYVCSYLDRVAEAGKLKGVAIDVGAHVGLWAMHLSEWYQNRYNVVPTIYAIEPDGLNYRQLLLNAQQPQTGITAINLAAWNKNTSLFFHQNTNPGRHKVSDVGVHGRAMMRVQGVALDSIASTKEQRQTDVLKIDVEGAELNVLNGARSILMDNDQLLVVVEYSLGHFAEYGYKAAQLTAFMREHGFKPARPVDTKTILKIRAGEIKRVIFVKGDIT